MLSPNILSTPTAWSEDDLQKSVFQRFQSIAEQYPLHTAIFNLQGERISYDQLLRKSLILAAGLHAATSQGKPDSEAAKLPLPYSKPVAILLPPGAEIISVMLAVIRLGSPFLPLDPQHPRERILAILHHAECHMIVCAEDEPLSNDVSVLCKTVTVRALLGKASASDRLPPEPLASDNAYILYTSGSTGNPKGVYQDQRGLLHDVMQYSKAIGISCLDCFTGFYSPSVNGAIRDIWAALLNGASLVPASPPNIGFAGMASLVKQFKVTIFHAIPPLLRAFLSSQPEPQSLSSVRLCYIAGDKFYAQEVKGLFRFFPDGLQIYTGIGSTECATLYRHWLLDKNTHLTTTLLPAGYAIEDRTTRLIESETLTDTREVKPGSIGFVQVESAFLAKGYWNNPALTLAAFMDVNGSDNQRRFMPGDCFRELSNGLYEYIGRADSQVKVLGHRIDVTDLEVFSRQWLAAHTGSQHPDVCKVFAIDSNGKSNVQGAIKLIWILAADLLNKTPAYVTDNIVPQLKNALTREYSFAAQHSAVLVADTLPRLPSFKLDMAYLKRWAESQIITDQRYITPTSDQLDAVLQDFKAPYEHVKWLQTLIFEWCEVFKVEPSLDMADHDFNKVGADSLAVMNFFAELDNRLGVRIDYKNIPLSFSLKDLYLYIAEHNQPHSERREGDKNLIIVPPFVGLAGLPEFDHLLDKNIKITKIPTTALYNPIGEMQPQLKDVVNKLVSYVEQIGVTGQLFFYGISSGAKPAFFAASQLQRAGADVRTIFVGDADPHGRAQHFGAERLRAFSWLTKDIPFINSTVIEIIAMKHRLNKQTSNARDEWKDYSMLGWYKYASKIGFITVPRDHVECLTDPKVMHAINCEIKSDAEQQLVRFATQKAYADQIKSYARSLFLSSDPEQLADAECWFSLLFVFRPDLKKIYKFNGPYSRLRAINRLRWQEWFQCH